MTPFHICQMESSLDAKFWFIIASHFPIWPISTSLLCIDNGLFPVMDRRISFLSLLEILKATNLSQISYHNSEKSCSTDISSDHPLFSSLPSSPLAFGWPEEIICHSSLKQQDLWFKRMISVLSFSRQFLHTVRRTFVPVLWRYSI